MFKIYKKLDIYPLKRIQNYIECNKKSWNKSENKLGFTEIIKN